MAHGTPKVDSMAKVVAAIGVLALLAVVYYFAMSIANTIKKNSTDGPVAENPKAPEIAKATPAPAAAPAAKAEPAAASGGAMGNAAAGKAKYASCAACHGADGKGNHGAFPDLTRLNANDAYDILKAFKSGDKDTLKKHDVKLDRYAIMAPNAASLSDDDMKNLAAYIAQLGGHSASAAPAAASSGGSAKGNATAGKTKYASCAACHGADGKGNHGAFPDLTRLNATETAEILHAFKKGDKDALKKYDVKLDRYAIMQPNAAHLSDADIDDIAAYVAQLGGHSGGASAGGEKKASAPAASTAKPAKPAWLANADVQFGHAMFSSCAVCHGNNAEGGRLVGAPKLDGLPAQVIKTMLETYRKGQAIGPNSYYMFTQAKHLTDSQIADLSAYIGSLSKKK